MPAVVFSHNDLLPGNILVLGGKHTPDTDADITFIDFEYGMPAPRGFDIGNHWNEYAGLDCDYSLYPSRAAQEHFVRTYLATDPASSAPVRADAMAEVPAAEVSQLVAEGNVFSLASHLFWGVWAIVQARYSAIDFDYIKYYHCRHGEMRRRIGDVTALLSETTV